LAQLRKGIPTPVHLFSHYLFASNTARMAAMYAAFGAAATATGAPPVTASARLVRRTAPCRAF